MNRQRLDSPLVYIGAHNVYYVKLTVKLRFRRSGSILTLINPTPYFITVTNMKAGNSNLPNTMVPPKGEVSVDIPHAVTGDISFQTINDYGALTPRIKATMQ